MPDWTSLHEKMANAKLELENGMRLELAGMRGYPFRADSPVRQFNPALPSKKHLETHVCAWMGCKRPLGYGPAEGIDDKIFHPGCAVAYQEFENAKAAIAAD